jgi:hypothetical protein
VAVRPEYFPGLEKRLTSVVWTLTSGIVFFRVVQNFQGESIYAEPEAKALVTGLPWAPFDMFALAGQNEVDPDSSVSGLVPISDPITSNMIGKYLYWPHRPKVHNVTTATADDPSGETFVIDLANWSPVLDGNIAFRVTTLMSREAATALWIDVYTAEGAIPSLFGPEDVSVTVINNFGQPLSEEEFKAIAPSAGWTYHYEPSTSPPIVRKTVIDTALVILNLAKLYRDMPLVDGKKPKTYTFKVVAPVNPHGGAVNFAWSITASAWIPKITDPPKEKQRVTFPVADAGPAEFMVPTFDHPDENASGSSSGTSEVEAEVTVTFGAANVAPQVTIIGEGESEPPLEG